MTTYFTQNPLGSSDPRDLYDNAENLDSLVNGDQSAYNDRLGKSRRSWQSVEDQVNQQADQYADDKAYRDSTFASDQTYRANAFQASQDDREGVFNAYLVSAGYQFAGDYASGIEITQYNQVVRDASGEFWRVSGSTTLPYTTDGSGLPEGGALVGLGDAVLRQELSQPQGAALVAGGSIIYRPSVQQLFALDGASLEVGQAAKVRGTEFAWSGTEWEPIGNIYVNSWGARGDAPERRHNTAGTNSRQAFIDAGLYARDHGHKYVFAEPGIYYAPDLLPSEMGDVYIVGDGVLFTWSDNFSDNRGHAQVIAMTSREYSNGLSYGSKGVVGKGVVAFELDDAYPSQWARMTPIFKEFGVVYGMPFHTANPPPFLRELHRHGFELMAHFPENSSASSMTREQLATNAESDIAAIRDITGRDDNIHFVYPQHHRNENSDDVLSQYYQTGRGLSTGSPTLTNDSPASWLKSAMQIDSQLLNNDLAALKDILKVVAETDSSLVMYGHQLNNDNTEPAMRELLSYIADLGIRVDQPRNIKRGPYSLVDRYFKTPSQFTFSSSSISWDESVHSDNDARSIRFKSDPGSEYFSGSFMIPMTIRIPTKKRYSQYRVSFIYSTNEPVSAGNFGSGLRTVYTGEAPDGSSVSGATQSHFIFKTLPASDWDNRITINVFAPQSVGRVELGFALSVVTAPIDLRIGDFRAEYIGGTDTVAVDAKVGERVEVAFVGGSSHNRYSVSSKAIDITGGLSVRDRRTDTSDIMVSSTDPSDTGKEVTIFATPRFPSFVGSL